MGHTLIPIRRRLTSFSGLKWYQIGISAKRVPVKGSKLKKESLSQEEAATRRKAGVSQK